MVPVLWLFCWAYMWAHWLRWVPGLFLVKKPKWAEAHEKRRAVVLAADKRAEAQRGALSDAGDV